MRSIETHLIRFPDFQRAETVRRELRTDLKKGDPNVQDVEIHVRGRRNETPGFTPQYEFVVTLKPDVTNAYVAQKGMLPVLGVPVSFIKGRPPFHDIAKEQAK